MSMKSCPKCFGSRLKKESRSVTVNDKSLGEISSYPIKEVKDFFNQIKLNKMDATIAEQIINEVNKRLSFLIDVGLDYLTLDRSATTLSGGEAQRVKLAKELSKRSTGKTVYILDEPTTGLHFADVDKLLEVLHLLVDKGNTVIVIEHNLDVIKNSDWIIDLGPEGGENGGNIVAEGTPENISKSKSSLTGKHLREVLING